MSGEADFNYLALVSTGVVNTVKVVIDYLISDTFFDRQHLQWSLSDNRSLGLY